MYFSGLIYYVLILLLFLYIDVFLESLKKLIEMFLELISFLSV